MKQYKWIIRLLAGGVVFGVLYFWISPPLNTQLRAYGIPQLPKSAVVEHSAVGGILFCHWRYAMVGMSESDFQRFVDQFQQKKQEIGRDKGEVMIAGPEEVDAAMRNMPDAEIANMPGYEGVNDWWRPNKIEQGCLIQQDSGDEGWWACFDSRNHVVFIFLHQS